MAGAWTGLLFLTVLTTFMAFFSGFDWEPDEHPATYWRRAIPQRQCIMVITMLVPAASAASATISMFACPYRPIRIVGASLVAVLALAAFFASWAFGIEAVNSAKYWAENVSGIRSGLPY